jgi:deoxyxylulose-5-phosphate synthase
VGGIALHKSILQKTPHVVFTAAVAGLEEVEVERNVEEGHASSAVMEILPQDVDFRIPIFAHGEKLLVVVGAEFSEPFGEKFPQRLFDTGIAEEHAMTFAAGLAAAGMRPCFAVYSTFFQRSVDQFLHDAALQRLPVTVCLDRAGITGEDGATHHGLYDLPFLLPVPNVKIYAPVSEGELKKALEQSFSEESTPSVIRYPKGTPDPLIAENFPLTEEIERKDYENGEKDGMIGERK